jgi:hypothetical protein
LAAPGATKPPGAALPSRTDSVAELNTALCRAGARLQAQVDAVAALIGTASNDFALLRFAGNGCCRG